MQRSLLLATREVSGGPRLLSSWTLEYLGGFMSSQSWSCTGRTSPSSQVAPDIVSGPGDLSYHQDALRPTMSWQLEFDEIILINIF